MSNAQVPLAILSFREARAAVEGAAARMEGSGEERVPLLQALGRVLARPIVADRDLPPFARSTRDGYAVLSADLFAVPTELELVGEIRAGAYEPDTLPRVGTGQAVEIMTGAPMPPGADAVVMVEHTTRSGSVVEARRSVAHGENVVARGAEALAGTPVVPAGTRIDYATVALAAAVGWTSPAVYQRPRVTVLSTGDEVVDVSASPGPHHIRNSNSYSLAAQIIAAGGEPSLLPIAPDEPKRLRQLMAEGLDSDLLLLSGGVSMGKYDLVEQVLTEFGAKFHFTGAAIQPGRPLVFGEAQRPSANKRTAFFGLPGNPVSTMVTFELFVRPVLEKLCGATPKPLRFLKARTAATVRHKPGLTRFLPATIGGEFEDATVELLRWQGSGDLVALARANCYIVIPAERDEIAAGELVSVLLRGAEF